MGHWNHVVFLSIDVGIKLKLMTMEQTTICTGASICGTNLAKSICLAQYKMLKETMQQQRWMMRTNQSVRGGGGVCLRHGASTF